MSKNISSFNKMTKSALEDYGRSLGIELDKRLKKSDLVKQIQEFLEAPQTIESIETRPDRVHVADTNADDIVDAIMAGAPKYTGENNAELSSYFFRNIGKINVRGTKKNSTVKFGPSGKNYILTVDGKKYKV